MPNTHIKYANDVRATQQRIILTLACGHNVSISEVQQKSENKEYQAGDAFNCPWCPAAPATVNEPANEDEARTAFEDLFQ